MIRRRALGIFLLSTLTILAQACVPNATAATQAPESIDPLTGAQQTLAAATQGAIDPVVGAQQTLAAATQNSLDALKFARETIAAANPESIAVDDSSLISVSLLSRPDDQSIQAKFTGRIVCSQFEVNLTNKSTTTFRSLFMSISIKDDPSKITVTSSMNGFLGYEASSTNAGNNCEAPTLLPSLEPGASRTVLFPRFNDQSSRFEGSIVLCPEDDLGGQCTKNSIDFTIIPVTADTASAVPSVLPPDYFQAEYVNTVHPACGQTWWVRVNITNKSDSAFKSISISVKDTATGDIAAESAEHKVFVDLDSSVCNPAITQGNDIVLDDLAAAESFTVSSGVFLKDPTSHPMEATIKLCKEEDLGEPCSSKTINFTPGITAQPTVDTSKPIYPYIVLSAGTYCRMGPGKEYDVVGAYAADIKIPVLGKESTGRYWVVASPNKGDTNIKCWLIGDFVKESGNLNGLEVYSAPPTPTPKPPTATPTPTLTPTSTSTP